MGNGKEKKCAYYKISCRDIQSGVPNRNEILFIIHYFLYQSNKSRNGNSIFADFSVFVDTVVFTRFIWKRTKNHHFVSKSYI